MIDPESQSAVSDALLAHLRVAGWPRTDYVRWPERIFGGNQSFVYGLELDGAEELRGPLILRILRPFLPDGSVVREAVLQAALREFGYPVARVGYHCDDAEVLGGPFQLMERLPGKPLLMADADMKGAISLKQALSSFAGFVLGSWPDELARLQHELHSLPLESVLDACERAGLAPEGLSLQAALERLKARARAEGTGSLVQIFNWVSESKILIGRPAVLCHGDFFPNQVLAENGRITGVIDWSDACVGPPELDVAIIVAGMETLPVPLGAVGHIVVKSRVRRFFNAYRKRAPLDAEALAHADVLRCAHSLVAVAERRRALFLDPGRPPNPNPYDTRAGVIELARRIEEFSPLRVDLAEFDPAARARL
jgi:aminoglycoside phosphotransferase (APT) family kinase protein